MAPKRSDPPAISSSEEVESEEGEDEPLAGVTKHTGSPKPVSDSDSHSDSDSDSDSDDDEDGKPSDLYPTTPIVKRNLEFEKAEKEKDSKRKKKKVADDADAEAEAEADSDDDHKNPFRRFWTEDDEIIILKAMCDSLKEGIHPTSDLDKFINKIKKFIHVSFNKEQLNNKIRRMKRKYLTNFKRGKDGKDPVFKNHHDLKSYKLMKEIWAGQEGKRNRTPKPRSGAVSPRPETVAPTNISGEELPIGEEKNWSLFPCLTESVQANKNLPIMGESLLKEGLGLIGHSKANELDQKWRKLHAAELMVYMQRNELLRELTMAVLNALNSSDA